MLTDIKVLIVEDEETLAENIMGYLQRGGGNIRIAFTGQQAIAAARVFEPDVILLDYHLPDMDGFEILDAIRAEQPDCACVLMTGHPIETLTPEAERRDIDDILSKPFALSEVEASLAEAMGAKRPFVPARPVAHERRQNDRRTQVCCILVAITLGDGTRLTQDRRVGNRRA